LTPINLQASRVHLHGKGDKWRLCPLWQDTLSMLKQLIHGREQQGEMPVFQSCKGQPLTRFGIYKIVRRHTLAVHKTRSDGSPKSVSPHLFRHSTAVHLLESGVEMNVIRAWLGHVSLETTNRYAEIHIRAKVAALEACRPPVAEDTHQQSVMERGQGFAQMARFALKVMCPTSRAPPGVTAAVRACAT
jgi:integrase/recombinase XerD